MSAAQRRATRERLAEEARQERIKRHGVQLLEALEGPLAIVADSHGVVGYHHNDDAAGWDEFEEIAVARAAIAAAKGES